MSDCHDESEKTKKVECCGHSTPSNSITIDNPDAEYTCPMHLEILQLGPGSCPLCGMALEPVFPTAEIDTTELDDMFKRFLVSIAFTVPLFFIAMAPMIPGMQRFVSITEGFNSYLQLALAAPVCLWAAWPFYIRGVESIKNRSLNMFTLIGIGVSVSFAYSLVAALVPEIFPDAFRHANGEVALYFEGASMIVALVLVGQVLELKARSKTGEAITKLLGLSPKTAHLIKSDGSEIVVDHVDIKIGDILLVKAGETVPVDGKIVEGKALVNESMLTGEPDSNSKGVGDGVTGATVNGASIFKMEATHVGNDTVLARIVTLVANAQRSQAPIQKLADQVSGYFVPTVLAVSVLTFLLWSLFGPAPRFAFALVNSIAVLIVACPCALGLATPMSIMVAMGRAAGRGVLFRDATAIETLRKVDTLVVDKTGTLTEGKPSVVEHWVVPGTEYEKLLGWAAAVEAASEHPIASSIKYAATKLGILFDGGGSVSNPSVIPGQGMTAVLNGETVAVGNSKLMNVIGVEIVTPSEKLASFTGSGYSVVHVATTKEFLGTLAISDPIKESSLEAITSLKKSGINIIMLSGDNEQTAKFVGSKLGIVDIVANVSPEEKLNEIERLKNDGRIVFAQLCLNILKILI